MGRLLKYLLWAMGLALLGLVGYALISDLPAPTEPVSVPLPVPANAP